MVQKPKAELRETIAEAERLRTELETERNRRHELEVWLDRMREEADELGISIELEYVDNPIPKEVYVQDTCTDHTKNDESDWLTTTDPNQGGH